MDNCQFCLFNSASRIVFWHLLFPLLNMTSSYSTDLRGLDGIPRGWSVSMFTGKMWQDLPGCDFVLDLIGEMEEGSLPSGSSPTYPITPERDESYSQQNSEDV